MRIVFASLGAYGHLYPMLPLALACQEAGHTVTIATGPPFLDQLPLPTVAGYPSALTLGWAEQETRRRHPDLHGPEFAIAMFGEVAAGTALPTMIDILTELEPDLIVYEDSALGAGVAASVLGVPSLVFATGLLPVFLTMLHPATINYQRAAWERHGLKPPTQRLLGAALIDPCPPSLLSPYEDAPRLPIRSIAYSAADTLLPPWLTNAPTRPRVYLTLGTVSFGAIEVIRRAATEIGRLDVELLVAVGPAGDPTLLGDLPANIHLERFVAQSAVLPRVDLIVHHGGTGTVLAALEAGIPQVILPQGADQPYNAELLVAAGAARSQTNEAYEPGSITALVAPLLGPCPERDVAHRIRDEIATMPTPADMLPTLTDYAHASL